MYSNTLGEDRQSEYERVVIGQHSATLEPVTKVLGASALRPPCLPYMCLTLGIEVNLEHETREMNKMHKAWAVSG